LTPEEHQKRYEDHIPEGKNVEPKDNEPTTMTKNAKTYHWLKKCHNGKGMWALHTTDKHKGRIFLKTKPDEHKKKVSFQTDTSSGSSETTDNPPTSAKDSSKNEKQGTTPSIQVKKELLANAKVYLAQF
jgi:hypothetical protein